MNACRHKHTCRVSSHDDLLAAHRSTDAYASRYCCDRPRCLTDAMDWVRHVTGLDPVVAPLPGKAVAP